MYERFESYSSRFPHLKMEREDGILVLTLHSDGGSLKWGLGPHEELSHAFRAIGADPENRCVVLSGTGDEFIGPRAIGDKGAWQANPPPYQWNLVFADARRMNLDMLEIPVPMIAAVNGPCYRHGNLPLMCDVVIASETASWEDKAHFSEQNLIPGDGVHVIYPLLMGYNRARYFLLTGQVINATEAKQLGLVNEVLPREQVLPRAMELARFLADKPTLLTRSTRELLIQGMRREMTLNFPLGGALESFVGWADKSRPDLDAERAGAFEKD